MCDEGGSPESPFCCICTPQSDDVVLSGGYGSLSEMSKNFYYNQWLMAGRARTRWARHLLYSPPD